jgi:vacuolar-type H+-ATPase subunit H
MAMGVDDMDMSVNIDDLLEKIEDILDSGTSIAFMNKTVVDVRAIRTCLEDIRLNMPTVIENAYNITADRSRIIADANALAEETVSSAKKKAEALTAKAKAKVDEYLTKSEEYSARVMTQAETDAQNILKEAQEQAAKLIEEHEITRQAKSYAAQIRKNAEDERAVILNEARQTADEMKARAQKWSSEIRVAASDFVDDIIKDTESSLANSLNEIRSAKQSLHAAIKNNEKN